MSASCERCGKPLAPVSQYCSACGELRDDTGATFVFTSTSDETADELFNKPAPEPTLGWQPIVAGLAAVAVIVAVIVAVSGTGRDVALAPTPTPVPSPEPSATPRPIESEAQIGENDDGNPRPVLGWPSLDDPPEGILRVKSGSDPDSYTAALMELAQTYRIEGTVVFGANERVVHLDLETGEENTIPLDDRVHRLGSRTGIVTKKWGEPFMAQRWDDPLERVEVIAGSESLEYNSGWFEITWTDPNGWELTRYHNDGAVVVLAPWASDEDGSVPTKELVEPRSFSFGPPIELFSRDPDQWTWDEGPTPLPWEKVLAWSEHHLLVEHCEASAPCELLVTNDHGEEQFVVDDSAADWFTSPESVPDDVALSPEGTGAMVASSANDQIVRFDVVDLATGEAAPIGDVMPMATRSYPYWLGEGLVVLPFVARGNPYDFDLIVDRAGTPVAVLEWSEQFALNTPAQPHLLYFASDR